MSSQLEDEQTWKREIEIRNRTIRSVDDIIERLPTKNNNSGDVTRLDVTSSAVERTPEKSPFLPLSGAIDDVIFENIPTDFRKPHRRRISDSDVPSSPLLGPLIPSVSLASSSSESKPEVSQRSVASVAAPVEDAVMPRRKKSDAKPNSNGTSGCIENATAISDNGNTNEDGEGTGERRRRKSRSFWNALSCIGQKSGSSKDRYHRSPRNSTPPPPQPSTSLSTSRKPNRRRSCPVAPQPETLDRTASTRANGNAGSAVDPQSAERDKDGPTGKPVGFTDANDVLVADDDDVDDNRMSNEVGGDAIGNRLPVGETSPGEHKLADGSNETAGETRQIDGKPNAKVVSGLIQPNQSPPTISVAPSAVTTTHSNQDSVLDGFGSKTQPPLHPQTSANGVNGTAAGSSALDDRVGVTEDSENPVNQRGAFAEHPVNEPTELSPLIGSVTASKVLFAEMDVPAKISEPDAVAFGSSDHRAVPTAPSQKIATDVDSISAPSMAAFNSANRTSPEIRNTVIDEACCDIHDDAKSFLSVTHDSRLTGTRQGGDDRRRKPFSRPDDGYPKLDTLQLSTPKVVAEKTVEQTVDYSVSQRTTGFVALQKVGNIGRQRSLELPIEGGSEERVSDSRRPKEAGNQPLVRRPATTPIRRKIVTQPMPPARSPQQHPRCSRSVERRGNATPTRKSSTSSAAGSRCSADGFRSPIRRRSLSREWTVVVLTTEEETTVVPAGGCPRSPSPTCRTASRKTDVSERLSDSRTTSGTQCTATTDSLGTPEVVAAAAAADKNVSGNDVSINSTSAAGRSMSPAEPEMAGEVSSASRSDGLPDLTWNDDSRSDRISCDTDHMDKAEFIGRIGSLPIGSLESQIDPTQTADGKLSKHMFDVNFDVPASEADDSERGVDELIASLFEIAEPASRPRIAVRPEMKNAALKSTSDAGETAHDLDVTLSQPIQSEHASVCPKPETEVETLGSESLLESGGELTSVADGDEMLTGAGGNDSGFDSWVNGNATCADAEDCCGETRAPTHMSNEIERLNGDSRAPIVATRFDEEIDRQVLQDYVDADDVGIHAGEILQNSVAVENCASLTQIPDSPAADSVQVSRRESSRDCSSDLHQQSPTSNGNADEPTSSSVASGQELITDSGSVLNTDRYNFVESSHVSENSRAELEQTSPETNSDEVEHAVENGDLDAVWDHGVSTRPAQSAEQTDHDAVPHRSAGSCCSKQETRGETIANVTDNANTFDRSAAAGNEQAPERLRLPYAGSNESVLPESLLDSNDDIAEKPECKVEPNAVPNVTASDDEGCPGNKLDPNCIARAAYLDAQPPELSCSAGTTVLETARPDGIPSDQRTVVCRVAFAADRLGVEKEPIASSESSDARAFETALHRQDVSEPDEPSTDMTRFSDPQDTAVAGDASVAVAAAGKPKDRIVKRDGAAPKIAGDGDGAAGSGLPASDHLACPESTASDDGGREVGSEQNQNESQHLSGDADVRQVEPHHVAAPGDANGACRPVDGERRADDDSVEFRLPKPHSQSYMSKVGSHDDPGDSSDNCIDRTTDIGSLSGTEHPAGNDSRQSDHRPVNGAPTVAMRFDEEIDRQFLRDYVDADDVGIHAGANLQNSVSVENGASFTQIPDNAVADSGQVSRGESSRDRSSDFRQQSATYDASADKPTSSSVTSGQELLTDSGSVLNTDRYNFVKSSHVSENSSAELEQTSPETNSDEVEHAIEKGELDAVGDGGVSTRPAQSAEQTDINAVPHRSAGSCCSKQETRDETIANTTDNANTFDRSAAAGNEQTPESLRLPYAGTNESVGPETLSEANDDVVRIAEKPECRVEPNAVPNVTVSDDEGSPGNKLDPNCIARAAYLDAQPSELSCSAGAAVIETARPDGIPSAQCNIVGGVESAVDRLAVEKESIASSESSDARAFETALHRQDVAEPDEPSTDMTGFSDPQETAVAGGASAAVAATGDANDRIVERDGAAPKIAGDGDRAAGSGLPASDHLACPESTASDDGGQEVCSEQNRNESPHLSGDADVRQVEPHLVAAPGDANGACHPVDGERRAADYSVEFRLPKPHSQSHMSTVGIHDDPGDSSGNCANRTTDIGSLSRTEQPAGNDGGHGDQRPVSAANSKEFDEVWQADDDEDEDVWNDASSTRSSTTDLSVGGCRERKFDGDRPRTEPASEANAVGERPAAAVGRRQADVDVFSQKAFVESIVSSLGTVVFLLAAALIFHILNLVVKHEFGFGR